MVVFLAACCPAEVASSLLHATVNRPRAANGIILKALIILLKADREPSHEDFRAAWSCLLWSRDVRVTPTSRCDFALTVWRACAVRRYCAQQESVTFVQRTISFTSRGVQNPSGERSIRRHDGEHKINIAVIRHHTHNTAAERYAGGRSAGPGLFCIAARPACA